MVERIINKIINEKIDIDRLLVVTFTNAAASEMRERILDAIYRKIEEEPEDKILQRQITLLSEASICTIDSFCLDIVRNYFYELENISPNFRIADTTEIELLKQEVIEDIFEKKYEEENKDFMKLITTYTSYRDDTPLKDLILNIEAYIQSNPFPKKWLKEKVEMFNIENDIQKDFSNTIWGKILLKDVEEELIDDIKNLQNIEEELSKVSELEKYTQTISNDVENIENLKNNLDNWDKAYEIYQNLTFNTWPRQKIDSEIKERAKTIRDDVKKRLTKKLSKILLDMSNDVNQDIFDMYIILQKLQNIVLEFSDEFSKRKREKNIVDFSDIEHFALSILLNEKEDGTIEKTQVAKKYQEKFIEVAIDEYQDSNLVQEYILTAVSNNNNIFMVGDVKQSIYKFRQAMPELFLKKYEDYVTKQNRKNNENLKIQLFKNFRSRENILNFTNIVFENIMSSELGDIKYNESEYLNLGADYEKIDQNLKTEIDIINLKEEENIDNENEEEQVEERIEDIEIEARWVANKIKELLENKYQVWDRKKGQYRNIEYRDIVVLLRATAQSAPIFEQEILNLEIPVFSDSSQEYLESIEIQTIMSLLKIIDNPMQDIPLVAVLRSNIGGFTDDELVQIRLTDKYDNFYVCMQKAKVNVDELLKNKITQFLNKIEIWRKEQEYMALDEFIWKIYSDTGFFNYVSLMPNGELRQANLKMLFERAKQYEGANFKGLYNFINFIEKLKVGSGDLGAAKIIGENDNVVRIMSIHKSKGLEFPVVFLSNTGKQFNLMDLNRNILLHQDLGIGVKYINYEKQIQYDTLTKEALKLKILQETLSEEMRILYVALTRAKEKLFITGRVQDYEKQIQNMQQQVDRYKKSENKINPILIKKYKKYLDWILLVYLYERKNIGDIVTLNILDKKDVINSLDKIDYKDIDVISKLEESQKDEDTIKKIEKIIKYTYPYEISTTLPTQTSVTELKKLYSNELMTEEQENINISVLTNTTEFGNFPKPKFLKQEDEKITSAQRGTLVHLCMQRLNENIEYDIKQIKDMIQSMVEKEIITPKEAETINSYKILNFTKSTIWKELKKAKEVQREKPFYMNILASEIYNENIQEDVLVQGIIDLYYINQNGELVLVDYKTDYVKSRNEQELIDKYKVQLNLYKRALEQAINKKVTRIYIYSIYLDKEIPIEFSRNI